MDGPISAQPLLAASTERPPHRAASPISAQENGRTEPRRLPPTGRQDDAGRPHRATASASRPEPTKKRRSRETDIERRTADRTEQDRADKRHDDRKNATRETERARQETVQPRKKKSRKKAQKKHAWHTEKSPQAHKKRR